MEGFRGKWDVGCRCLKCQIVNAAAAGARRERRPGELVSSLGIIRTPDAPRHGSWNTYRVLCTHDVPTLSICAILRGRRREQCLYIA